MSSDIIAIYFFVKKWHLLPDYQIWINLSVFTGAQLQVDFVTVL